MGCGLKQEIGCRLKQEAFIRRVEVIMEEILMVQNLKKTFKISAKQQKLEKTKEKIKVAVRDLSFVAYRGRNLRIVRTKWCW